MKKLTSIALATLLLVSTIGVTVHKHYCDNILVSTSVLPHADDACDSSMPMDDNSCEDQHEFHQVNSPLVVHTLGFELAPSFQCLPVSFFKIVSLQSNKLTAEPKLYADANPPPPEPNIYTKVQAFLL